MITQTKWNRIFLAAAFVLTGLFTEIDAQIQNWSLISPTGAVPVARGGHGMVYDSTHGRMVMFGGASSSGALNDVWEFDVATKTWTNVTPTSGPAPSPRSGFAMGHDPVRNKIVIHGGSNGPAYAHPTDTWEWDTVNRTWAYMPNGGLLGGIGLLGPAMSFDPHRNQLVLFGGRRTGCCDAKTYAWNGNKWIDISPANSPSGRAYHMMATDTARSKIVLFGGWQGNLLNDTWEWDGSTWTQISTAAKPPERHISGMSYDSERGVMVLFGGWSGYNPGYSWNDTWTYDGQDWTQQQPCDLPSPRMSVAMAYDPVKKRHVMFGGGLVSGGSSNETWFYGTGLGSFPCGDATAPVTAANSTAPNGAGWNSVDVAVQLQASDGEDGTGVQDITYSASGAHQIGQITVSGDTANFVITAEGETVISYSARDNAGNVEAAQILTIRIDKTAPSVSCESPDGAWHANDVNISCEASDGISGLANSGDSGFNLMTSVPANSETANASTNTKNVCDPAGNCAAAGPIGGNKIDKKAPEISITSPAPGTYLLNQTVNVSYACSDGGSGVANCTGTTTSGGSLDTSSVGSKAFSVSSTDNAGNAALSAVVNYTVVFSIEVLFDQTRAHKSGSAVPIKVRLLDANGVNVSGYSTALHALGVVQISTQASEFLNDAGASNPDFDFRYDPTTEGYIFNLKTTGFQTGGYMLNFTAGGQQVYSVAFQVRQ